MSYSDVYAHRFEGYQGWWVEKVTNGSERCHSWLLLPAENLWNPGVRAFLYILALVWIFLGIAIISDIFMMSIERITSKKRTIVIWDEEKQQKVEKEVFLWNETVANLTLMALGSSAPEILMAIIESISRLSWPPPEPADSLGFFTIVGSAAFNLLIITGICIMSVPSPNVKRISEFGVFLATAGWSLFAYIWMLLCTSVISENEIDPWEAWMTLLFFPILVIHAYLTDNKCGCIPFCRRRCAQVDSTESTTNVRVLGDKGLGKEVELLEQQQKVKKSVTVGSNAEQWRHEEEHHMNRARLRFRHAAVRSMLGGKKYRPGSGHEKHRMANVVAEASIEYGINIAADENLCGKFTFGSPSYSVLESAGHIEVTILFHRRPPNFKKLQAANGIVANGNVGSSGTGSDAVVRNLEDVINSDDKPLLIGDVTVEYETREGSAKENKDFKRVSGKLTLKDSEYKQKVKIPIINDDEYENDVEFYVILKNPSAQNFNAQLGDPSVTRITIIDDDEPGEFQFEHAHYNSTAKSNVINANIIRRNGCDGQATLEYQTIDGTAKGGEVISDSSDYQTTQGVLEFAHGETEKIVSIPVNKERNPGRLRNFIVTLRNPSFGAKIGEHSAAVMSIGVDALGERLEDIVRNADEEEDEGWLDQFKNAMQISGDVDDDGKELPPSCSDYILHFLSFFWKVLFALVPPRKYAGAYPSFVFSLLGIGILTMVVEQLGYLLGCVTGLETTITGITIIAIGTSLPDTFASRTAALQDQYADAAIGNVTGSNSVNVFLGLGLPWVISSLYYTSRGGTYAVRSENLFQAITIYSICACICLIIIMGRRKIFGGELGGKPIPKYLTAFGCILLWFVFVILASLKALNLFWTD